VPVDGKMTLDLEGMFDVLKALKAPLMIPMHFFSSYTLHRFLDQAQREWTVEMSQIPSVLVTKTTLPAGAGAAGTLTPRRCVPLSTMTQG
jgi:hypothetical protein